MCSHERHLHPKFLFFSNSLHILAPMGTITIIQQKLKVDIAQLWQHKPRQLHYSNNLSKNRTAQNKQFSALFLKYPL